MVEFKKKAVEFSLTAEKKDFCSVKIQSSYDAASFCRQFYFDDINIFESAFLVMLNGARNVIGYAKISQGGRCGTVVDTMIVCKYAVDCLATSVILVHNHPSGVVRPSREDASITLGVSRALECVGCRLDDHIILSSEPDIYFSFRDEGEL